ncbi:hypothetical protein [Arthrobacter citreus]|uniref:hypothetical protein n=1 Tax=Arthrobacter citreus TaxID=1670 RepID=UPI0031F7976B
MTAEPEPELSVTAAPRPLRASGVTAPRNAPASADPNSVSGNWMSKPKSANCSLDP